jgi:hypothetical protein
MREKERKKFTTKAHSGLNSLLYPSSTSLQASFNSNSSKINWITSIVRTTVRNRLFSIIQQKLFYCAFNFNMSQRLVFLIILIYALDLHACLAKQEDPSNFKQAFRRSSNSHNVAKQQRVLLISFDGKLFFLFFIFK